MRSFIDIYNSEYEIYIENEQAYKIKNIRYILKEYDENYPISDLVPIFNKIMNEYQELSGKKMIDKHLQKLDAKAWIEYKMKAIDLAVISLQLGYKQGAEDIIKSFKLRVEPNEDALTRLYKSINNRLKLKEGKEKEDLVKEEAAKKMNWDDMRVTIQDRIKILPDYNCTVALYLSYEKRLKTA